LVKEKIRFEKKWIELKEKLYFYQMEVSNLKLKENLK
jgi:hypothetical protein